jgi:hypothetical protein
MFKAVDVRIKAALARYRPDLRKTTGALPVNQVPSNIPGTRIEAGTITETELSFDPVTEAELTPSHNHTSASADGGVLTNDAHDGYSDYTEISAPATPGANVARLYAKDVSGVTGLFYKDSAGTERDLSTLTVPIMPGWYEDGALSVGTSKGPLRRVIVNTTIVGCYIYVKTAPTGASLIVDIKRSTTGPDGTYTTLFSSLPAISAAAFSGSSTSLSITTLDAGDYLRMDITQVGSTVAGSSLTVDLFQTMR